MAMNYTNGLKSVLDYFPIAGSKKGKLPCLAIYKENVKGRSFMITQDAMWKYMEPYSYKADEQAMKADAADFFDMGREFAKKENYAKWQLFHGHLIGEQRQKMVDLLNEAKAGYELGKEAIALAEGSKYYLCTAFNLIVAMRGLEITPCKQPKRAAAQLLLWIQMRLPDLQVMPDYSPEMDHDPIQTEGHVEVKLGGDVIVSTDIQVSESQLTERENLASQLTH